MSRHALEVPYYEPQHRDDDREVDAPSRAAMWAFSADVSRRIEADVKAGQLSADLSGDGPVYAYDSHGRLIGELGEPIPVTPNPIKIRSELPPFLEESMRRQNPDHPRSNGW